MILLTFLTNIIKTGKLKFHFLPLAKKNNDFQLIKSLKRLQRPNFPLNRKKITMAAISLMENSTL